MKSIKVFSAFVLASFVLIASCEKDDDNTVVENFNSLTVPASGYWNGSDNSGGFTINGITFPNTYSDGDWGPWWNGFAYSNLHDRKTPGMANQFSSYSKKDSASNNIFVLAYPSFNYLTKKFENNIIVFDNVVSDVNMKVTNSTYAALSMKNSDSFGKKFGGDTGNDPDWFKLQIIGIGENSLPTDTVDFFLADFTFADNTKDYILNEWKSVNLGKLGKVKKLKFELSSSDNNSAGMKTPAYFCMDDINYKPVAKTE